MKVLIIVKTYPTISETREDEFVCTAGITEDGKWIRMYPVPFRRLDYVYRYKKYNWININLKKSKGNEKEACEGVKQKCLNDLAFTKDLYFFLGTNYIQHSKKTKNPFLIIGLFYPPIDQQLILDF